MIKNRKNYVICADVESGRGIVSYILSAGDQWYGATNSALKFGTRADAEQYARAMIARGHGRDALIVVIGPRNGRSVVR